MTYYLHTFNNIQYIVLQSLSPISGFDEFYSVNDIPDFTYTENKIYRMSDKIEIDSVSSVEILEDFKAKIYKNIKDQIFDTAMLTTLYSKYIYTSHAYHVLLLSNESFTGSMADLYEAIKNNEIPKVPMALNFLEYYKIYNNIEKNVINVLNDFDKVFLNDESTQSELLAVINNIDDLAVKDPYTFLKERIYI